MYFLNINKPKGMSSFDVIRELRKRLKIKQIGHSGTLDPLASGVLQIAVGKATKLLDYLESDKEYIADIIFGYVTDTFDSEGEIKFVKEPNFSIDTLNEVLNSFLGITIQIPPKYSAIKLNGQKLCDLARNNMQIDINAHAREIEIYSIELLEFDNYKAKIKVFCKKGTYIRSLVNDIGQKLGCGAYMSDLIRTKAGNFDIENSNKLDDEFCMLNPLDVIKLPQIILNDGEYEKIKNGNSIFKEVQNDSQIVLLTKNNKLVSIANLSDNQIKPKKFFKEDE
ncbi:MAG: tRNA pseudouridine(55) synthase TruB [Candidatus Gastranaerophilales bacterium]|nr:tRNA pseudouridine(55) synthase TruB [Candidatus Gastranaerophilales bacterium]